MELNIKQFVADIKAHKEEAKLLRDEGCYVEAVKELELAILAIDRSRWDEYDDDNLRLIAWHLADCIGMVGGNYRRLEYLDKAAAAFDRGAQYEVTYGLNSSYNLVNAIVVRIESGAKGAYEQRDALLRAISALEEQVRSERRIDRWAWADLGQCRLLLGDLPEAKKAYTQFLELSDSESVKSARSVLLQLREALGTQDHDIDSILEQGIELLAQSQKNKL